MTAGLVIHDPALTISVTKSTIDNKLHILAAKNRCHAQLAASFLLPSEQPLPARIAHRMSQSRHHSLGSRIDIIVIVDDTVRDQLTPESITQNLNLGDVPVLYPMLGDTLQPAVHHVSDEPRGLAGP